MYLPASSINFIRISLSLHMKRHCVPTIIRAIKDDNVLITNLEYVNSSVQ